MNDKYRKYLKSNKWKAKRQKLFSIRGKKCERCDNTDKLHIHHKTYKRIYKERLSDLEILCVSCHEKEHGRSFSKPLKANRYIPKGNKKKNKPRKTKEQKIEDRIKKLFAYWTPRDCAKR